MAEGGVGGPFPHPRVLWRGRALGPLCVRGLVGVLPSGHASVVIGIPFDHGQAYELASAMVKNWWLLGLELPKI